MFESLSAIVPAFFLLAEGHGKPQVRHAIFVAGTPEAFAEAKATAQALLEAGFERFGLAALVDGEIEPLAEFWGSDFEAGFLEERLLKRAEPTFQFDLEVGKDREGNETFDVAVLDGFGAICDSGTFYTRESAHDWLAERYPDATQI